MRPVLAGWGDRLKAWNLSVAAALFPLQLIHLLWLSVDVVFPRLFGVPAIFDGLPWVRVLLILVDYTEIPALITTSLVFVDSFRETRKTKDLLYLAFLNLQWFHLFWITDEFVLAALAGTGGSALLPLAAWGAMFIDYLEVPVMAELLVRVTRRTPAPSS